jgi:hypothetical protein
MYKALFVLLFCIALFYVYQYIQEGYGGRGGRGGWGRGMGRGIGRGGWGRGIGRGYYGGPRRRVFYYPTYFQDYTTPDVYIYPAKTSYVASFNDYLRWLFGYR